MCDPFRSYFVCHLVRIFLTASNAKKVLDEYMLLLLFLLFAGFKKFYEAKNINKLTRNVRKRKLFQVCLQNRGFHLTLNEFFG